MKYSTGHISPFWGDEYKKFSYVRQPLQASEIEAWQKMGYDYVKSFSGQMYDNRNPMPDWITGFEDKFGLKNQTYNFYKMSQLEIMPVHSDHYQTYMRLFGAKLDRINRVLVMMEDWRPGHYLEIDGKGFVNWRAGDYFQWENSTPHAAANIGIDPRYTLQITGELI